MKLTNRTAGGAVAGIALGALAAGVAMATLAGPGAAPVHAQDTRDQIRIVGSSTVYPFSSAVAEQLGTTTQYATPVVESTGSGGGHKLFGSGVGINTPDITNSSRRMKVSEFETAQENGVGEITEAIIGYDGISIAQNTEARAMDLTLEQVALALLAEVPQGGELVANPYTNWNQIDPDLPDREILVYGPPTTSGTRDAFEELALEVVTEEMEGYDGAYTKIRTDGPFVPAGENDNLIVQRLAQDADALGIFGYSFLEENLDKVEAVTIEGVAPTSDSISSGEYPLSRSLYFYVKNAHVGVIPGMKEFLDLFMSEKMIGRRGYLRTLGLVPLPEDMRAASRKRVEELSPITRIDDELTDIHAYMEGKE